jgi:Yip1 domain
MSLVTRITNILTKPAAEWEVIANEPATVGGLFTGYAVLLAAIAPIMSILFMGVLGIGAGAMALPGMSIGMTFIAATAIAGYVISLLVLYLMSMIVKAVSPSFNGNSDMVQATKLMTYASTPAWVAGLLSWIPGIGFIISLAAIAYVVYLIYLGLKPVMGIPQEKLAGFTVVIVLAYIVLSMVLSAILVGVVVSSVVGTGMMAGAATGM